MFGFMKLFCIIGVCFALCSCNAPKIVTRLDTGNAHGNTVSISYDGSSSTQVYGTVGVSTRIGHQ